MLGCSLLGHPVCACTVCPLAGPRWRLPVCALEGGPRARVWKGSASGCVAVPRGVREDGGGCGRPVRSMEGLRRAGWAHPVSRCHTPRPGVCGSSRSEGCWRGPSRSGRRGRWAGPGWEAGAGGRLVMGRRVENGPRRPGTLSSQAGRTRVTEHTRSPRGAPGSLTCLGPRAGLCAFPS